MIYNRHEKKSGQAHNLVPPSRWASLTNEPQHSADVNGTESPASNSVGAGVWTPATEQIWKTAVLWLQRSCAWLLVFSLSAITASAQSTNYVEVSTHDVAVSTNAVAVSTNAAMVSTNVLAIPLRAVAIPYVSPGLGVSLFRVVGALALVIAVFLGGVWLFRNWQRLVVRRGRAPKLNVLETRSLGGRQAIYVVAYEQERFLLASSQQGVNLLTHLPPDTESTAAVTASATATATATATAPAFSFAQTLTQMLKGK